MQKEEWKPVKDYEGLYEISNLGNIKSLQKRNLNKILSKRIDRAGYLTVRLSKKGKNSTMLVHRLLGLAFIRIVKDKPFINHINGNRLDNSLDNLEWVNHSENIKHAYKLGLIKSGTKVIDICTGETYFSIMEASKAINIKYGTCKNYLNGSIKTNKTCLRLAS